MQLFFHLNLMLVAVHLSTISISTQNQTVKVEKKTSVLTGSPGRWDWEARSQRRPMYEMEGLIEGVHKEGSGRWYLVQRGT